MTTRLQDIASDLNLSKMTISKVLRGQTDISAETKARVLKRAKELNYRPNVTARSLRTGRTHSAGIVLSTMLDDTIAEMISGLNEVIRAANYSLVCSFAESNPEAFASEIESHLSRQADLLFLYRHSAMTGGGARASGLETPCIYLGGIAAPDGSPFVGLREEAVGRLAANHLLSCGCRRIACLREPRTAGGDQRFTGFLAALRSAEVPLRQDWVIEASGSDSQYKVGVEAGRKLFSARLRPDGVMAWNDLAASGVRDVALEAAMRFPAQVQILGCGNRIDVCEQRLPLSSIDLSSLEIGRRAARLALKILKKEAATDVGNIWVPAKVVQRSSTRAI